MHPVQSSLPSQKRRYKTIHAYQETPRPSKIEQSISANFPKPAVWSLESGVLLSRLVEVASSNQDHPGKTQFHTRGMHQATLLIKLKLGKLKRHLPPLLPTCSLPQNRRPHAYSVYSTRPTKNPNQSHLPSSYPSPHSQTPHQQASKPENVPLIISRYRTYPCVSQ